MSVIENVQQHIVPLIKQNGYEVVEVTYEKKFGVNNLTIYIYKKGGITLDDCEIVTHMLDEPFEAFDITMGEMFQLNISSPGLDRPICTEDDFRRNVGEIVEILFLTPQTQKARTFGELTAWDADTVTLKNLEKEKNFDRNKIKKIIRYIKF